MTALLVSGATCLVTLGGGLLVLRLQAYRGLVLDEVNVKDIDHKPHQGGKVALDLRITPELQAEGDLREFVRQIQDMRKQAALQPKDRIVLCIQTSKEGEMLIDMFRKEIERIAGAELIAFAENSGQEVTAGEHSFTVTLQKR